MKKACKKCRRLTKKNVCPACGSVEFSKRWSGLAIILDPSNSKVADKLEITEKGEYALIVQ